METWKDIPEYEGCYEVSNTGKIKSYDRIVKGEGRKPYFKPGRILKPAIGSHGYWAAALCKDQKQISTCLHVLIAKAFIPNPNNYRCINHKDGDKLNNDIENLEWVSHSVNNKHAYDTGLKKPFRKATTERVIEIRALHKYLKLTPTQLAGMYGLVQPTISQIVHFKSRNNG